MRSDATTATAALATWIALAFAARCGERWLSRRRPYDATWALAMALFAAGAGGLWWGSALGWSGAAFRWFFLFGAVLNVPYLALGQLQLLRGPLPRVRRTLDVAAGFAAGAVLLAPFTAPVAGDELPRGSAVFSPLPRILAAVGSGVSALIVFAAAGWSALRLTRRGRGRAPAVRRRAAGTGLVALGTLVLSMSGLLNGVLGEMEAFAVTLAVGVCVLFAGYLTATTAAGGPAVARPATPTGPARLQRQVPAHDLAGQPSG